MIYYIFQKLYCQGVYLSARLTITHGKPAAILRSIAPLLPLASCAAPLPASTVLSNADPYGGFPSADAWTWALLLLAIVGTFGVSYALLKVFRTLDEFDKFAEEIENRSTELRILTPAHLFDSEDVNWAIFGERKGEAMHKLPESEKNSPDGVH